MWDKINSGIFTDNTFIKKVNRTPLNDVLDCRHGNCVCVGEEMSSDCVIDVIRVLSKFEHWVSNRTILLVYYDWKIILFDDYWCPTFHC